MFGVVINLSLQHCQYQDKYPLLIFMYDNIVFVPLRIFKAR